VTDEYKWSGFQAAKAFLRAVWDDVFGYATKQKNLLAKLQITQKIFDCGGREINCFAAEQCAGLPPVLFLHGTPGNGFDWAWFLKKMAGNLHVIAPDRPGFGPEDKRRPDLDKDMAALGEILSYYAEDGQKPVIVGHSLGGGLAARLAIDYPDKVRGVVFVGASLDPDLERIFPVQEAFAKAPLSWLLTRSVRNSNIELLQYPGFLRALQPRLKEIKCPVAVLHARNDRLVPYANVDYIRSHCTGAAAVHIIELETGGHYLNFRRPQDVIKALASL